MPKVRNIFDLREQVSEFKNITNNNVPSNTIGTTANNIPRKENYIMRR